MNLAANRTLLGRLRASAQLAALVLLVFALKVGVAAACAKHDFADLGLGTESAHEVVVKASSTDAGDFPGSGKLASAGACSHGGCHHAAAMVQEARLSFALTPQEVALYLSGVPPSALPTTELRPPIA